MRPLNLERHHRIAQYLETAPAVLVHKRGCEPGGTVALPAHESPRIVYVRHGSALVKTPLARRRADPTVLVVIQPGVDVTLSPRSSEPDDCLVIVAISPSLLRRLALRHRPRGRRTPSGTSLRSSWPALQLLVHALVRETGGAGCRKALDRLGYELARRALVAPPGPTPLDPSDPKDLLVDRALRILADRFHEPVCLDRLAKETRASKSHLCRTFRTRVGVSVISHVHRLRLSAAIDRLYRGVDDLLGLALELGYDSHSHFTRLFRRELGLTPSEFREQMTGPAPLTRFDAPTSPRIGRSA